MASLSQAKTLGGVGAILALLFWVPAHVGIVLLIVGLVLMLFTVKNIIATVVLLAAAASFLGALGGFTPGTMSIPSGFFAALGFVILAGVVLWVCILISTVFVKRSYDVIAIKLRVDMFRTTGLLFLIGAATLIVLVGFVILFIAAILQVVAFFSIPEQLPSQAPPQQVWGPPAPPAPMPPSLTPAQ